MSSEHDTPISVTPAVKVGDQVFINEAAIELLQGRVESRVLASIVKTIGIPITGGGIIAILVAAVYWIPTQVGKVVEENETIKKHVASTVETYLADGEGQQFLKDETAVNLRKSLPAAIDRQLDSAEIERLVAQQLPKSVESYLSTDDGGRVIAQKLPDAVGAYMAGTAGQKVIADRLGVHLQSEETATLLKTEIANDTPGAVAAFLSQGAGKGQIEQIVKDQVDGKEMERIIRETVNQVLRNTATARTESMAENRGKAITVIATPRIEKGEEDLRDFLDRPETQAAGDQGLPLAISFTVGRRYVPDIIEDYITKTMQRYPLCDIYLVLHEGGGKCLAFCGPVVRRAEEITRLRDDAGRSELVDLIDAARDDDFAPTVRGLRDLELPVITAQLPQSESLESALRSDVWSNPDDMTEPVVVVGNGGQFQGTTTRGQIITALLGK